MTVVLTPTDTTAKIGQLTLRVAVPGGPSHRVDLASARCRLGSSSSCTLTLLAPGVSDVHCDILRETHGSVVRCLAEGTRLNGEEFAESPLGVGDRLTLGPLEIEVVADERIDAPSHDEHLGQDACDAGPNEPPAPPLDELEQAAVDLIADKQTAPLSAAPLETAGEHRRLAELEALIGPLAQYQDQWDATRQKVEAWVDRAEQLEQSLAQVQEQNAAWREQLREWQADRVATEADMQQRLRELASIVRETLADQVMRDEAEESLGPFVPAPEDNISMSEIVNKPLSMKPPDNPPEARPASAAVDSVEPLSEDDLTFEAVSEDAPLSAAEVCRQFGVPLEADDEPAVPHPPTPKPSTPNPSKSDGGEQEEQEAIEQYMASLLRRMQSGAAAAPSWPPPKADEDTAESFAPLHVPEDPIAEDEFVPRAQAPEASCDLSAMRALANTSARKAIDSHDRRSQALATQGKLIVAGFALVFSFVLMWFSAAGSTVASWSALLALIVAIYWAGRYLMLTRTEDLAKLRRKRRKKQPSQATLTDPTPADVPAPSASD